VTHGGQLPDKNSLEEDATGREEVETAHKSSSSVRVRKKFLTRFDSETHTTKNRGRGGAMCLKSKKRNGGRDPTVISRPKVRGLFDPGRRKVGVSPYLGKWDVIQIQREGAGAKDRYVRACCLEKVKYQSD